MSEVDLRKEKFELDQLSQDDRSQELVQQLKLDFKNDLQLMISEYIDYGLSIEELADIMCTLS